MHSPKRGLPRNLIVMLISCQCLALARTKSQKHAVEMELEQMKSEMQSSENALTQARLAQKNTESELKTVRREQKKVEAELTATILDKQKAEATIFDMVCSLERWQLQPIINGKEDFIAVYPIIKTGQAAFALRIRRCTTGCSD